MSGKPGRQRAWSWYRLDDDVAAAIVASASIRPGTLVLDLGAGTGTLTAALVARRATIVAFELHPQRCDHLRRRFRRDRVKVVRADVRDLRLPRQPFRVVANPPFDGVSAVLVRLTSAASRLERADLVVPRSVAAHWWRRLERKGSAWQVTDVRPLPRRAFVPRPRIDCCVMVIERRR